MTRLTAAVVMIAMIGALACAPIGAAAATANNAALKKAKADCKAQVKEYAKYNETSRYTRYKMVKRCAADAVAK